MHFDFCTFANLQSVGWYSQNFLINIMFQSNKVYIQIYRNRVTIVNLNTGVTATQVAVEPFSTRRSVLSSFAPANKTVRAAMRELGLKWSFLATRGVIQQMEDTEGGLTDIEKRALRDLAEEAGIGIVYIATGELPLSTAEALAFMKGEFRW